jgi:hypothetical protein
MGRPPLYGKAMLIRVEKTVPGRIDKVLRPEERRADFLRAAIERELTLREKIAESRLLRRKAIAAERELMRREKRREKKR